MKTFTRDEFLAYKARLRAECTGWEAMDMFMGRDVTDSYDALLEELSCPVPDVRAPEVKEKAKKKEKPKRDLLPGMGEFISG